MAWELLRLLKVSLWTEADFQALVEGLGDSAEFGEGVSFIVCALKSRNDGLIGTNKLCKFGLRESGRGACVVDNLSDFELELRFVDVFPKLGIVSDDMMLDDFESVRGRPGFRGRGVWLGVFVGSAHSVSSVRWLAQCQMREFVFLRQAVVSLPKMSSGCKRAFRIERFVRVFAVEKGEYSLNKAGTCARSPEASCLPDRRCSRL